MKSSEELREIMGTPEYVGKLLPQEWWRVQASGERKEDLERATLAVSQDRVIALEVVLLSKVELASLASLVNYDCVLMLKMKTHFG